MKTYTTFSSVATRRLGAAFAKKILGAKHRRRGALALALIGHLGTGKTVFARGVLGGLGVSGRVVSPTFLIMKRFPLRGRTFRNAYHFDCYRLRRPRELLPLGLQDILSERGNIVLIEWAERVRRLLPRETMTVRFTHGTKPNERHIRF